MASRIIDLTFPIHEGMLTFPAPHHPFVEITQLARHGVENRETRRISLGTHTGTHCDAPLHFIPHGSTVDLIPPETLVGPAIVCDFREFIDRGITTADLENSLGRRPPERIVLWFDWSKHFGRIEYYSGHGYLTSEAAEWLVANGCKLLAMDTPQPDNPRHGRQHVPDSPIHKILLGANVVLVEYLTNLDQLQSREIELIVAPLKIVGSDGAPLRCFAIERDRAGGHS